jgi:hypothetical protein
MKKLMNANKTNNPMWNPISREKHNEQLRKLIPVSSQQLSIKLRKSIKSCQKCGGTKNLEIHHLNKNKRDNRLDNLIVVCHGCHQIVYHDFINRVARKKKVFSKEHIRRLGDSVRARVATGWKPKGKSRPGALNPMFGRHHSKETKRKIGLVHLGKPLRPETLEKMRVARVAYLKTLRPRRVLSFLP